MKKNVLIVEDNEKSRRMLVRMLREIDSNLIIFETENLDSAYRYAIQNTINLFLLDIVLDKSFKGDTSGITFAYHMREIPRYKFIPIIFITVLEDPKLYAYSELHCYKFIEKPYDEEKVMRIIREALNFGFTEDKSNCTCFRKDGLLLPVEIGDIAYIIFHKLSTDIFFTNDILSISRYPMKRMLLKLNGTKFVQCSRNTIVNVKYIKSIDLVNGYLQIKDMSVSVPVGEAYKKRIVSELEDVENNLADI